MISKLVCSLYASSMLKLLEERNLDPKDGQEFITLTMVIWLFVLMYCTIIWLNTILFPTMIWGISLEKLCMEDTLLMIGIEEQIERIWKSLFNLSWCNIISIWLLISRVLIAASLIMENTANISKKIYHLRCLRCMECILMLKLDIWTISALNYLLLYWKFKQEVKVVEDHKQILGWLKLSMISWREDQKTLT